VNGKWHRLRQKRGDGSEDSHKSQAACHRVQKQEMGAGRWKQRDKSQVTGCRSQGAETREMISATLNIELRTLNRP
jgi:hypothetical protein